MAARGLSGKARGINGLKNPVWNRTARYVDFKFIAGEARCGYCTIDLQDFTAPLDGKIINRTFGSAARLSICRQLSAQGR